MVRIPLALAERMIRVAPPKCPVREAGTFSLTGWQCPNDLAEEAFEILEVAYEDAHARHALAKASGRSGAKQRAEMGDLSGMLRQLALALTDPG